MSADDFDAQEDVEEYEAPKVEDLGADSEPAVTAAGVDSIVG